VFGEFIEKEAWKTKKKINLKKEEVTQRKKK
jgi:hypothetical protein